ncbi:MAG: phage replisome organizer N-terminal domain-containing protein [Bacteroidetes bacterium]|nr:phage replisome organizer N-terminal domain-containing protein [Patescibacteria group bacterium]MBU1677671.1 phage replisome organizer N-terminal domain-containing protein [Bacteroidota bacterium]
MNQVTWIKISVNIFEDEKLKLISSLPEGDAIQIVWLRLLCLAGKANQCGDIFLTEQIPYTPEMLSTLFNKPLPIIQLALRTLIDFRMIQIDENSSISVINWEKYQNVDGMEKIKLQWKEASKRNRKNQKLLLEPKNEASSYDESNDVITQNRIEKNRIYKETYREFVTLTDKEYDKLVERYGKEQTEKMFDILNNYKGSKGKKYKSDYHAILSWVSDKVNGDSKGKGGLQEL